VVIALIVTPDGFPLAYEVLPGNTADCTTLRDALRKIEVQYGKADRIWIMLCAVLSYVKCGPIGDRLRCSWEAPSPHN
jgi:transposase